MSERQEFILAIIHDRPGITVPEILDLHFPDLTAWERCNTRGHINEACKSLAKYGLIKMDKTAGRSAKMYAVIS